MPFRGEGDHTITIFSGELAILLVYRRMLPGVLQGLTSKAAEILILTHFGIIDMTLATDPLQQDSFLCRGGITAKAIANLHE